MRKSTLFALLLRGSQRIARFLRARTCLAAWIRHDPPRVDFLLHRLPFSTWLSLSACIPPEALFICHARNTVSPRVMHR
jgi:hypothetical protein